MDAIEKKIFLNKISQSLKNLDSIPLLRTFAPFDFEKLSEELKKLLSLKELKVEYIKTSWETKEKILSVFSKKIDISNFILTPLEGEAFLIIEEENISKIIKNTISNEKNIEFTSPVLKESYFRYLLVNVLSILNKMNLFQDLSIKILEKKDFDEENVLSLDFKIKFFNESIFLKILISEKLRFSYEKYFNQNPPLKILELSSNVMPVLNVEIGKVSLYLEDLKNLSKGDFLLLDEINFDLKNKKGEVKINLNKNNIFIAAIKHNKLKILDFANISKESTKMKSEENFENEASIDVEKTNPELQKITNLPMEIIVEAGRFKMPLNKLLNLQPGNIIDLEINPESNVDLVVNSQKIGSGELVQIGESLGVKVTEIG
ncbi:MAG: hypothetical protein A3F40_00735 [Chlamydiae bacterium RIFCSPHIGHO2_12_FULL_27_8]|nr:MAG: hypothetical protein A3F40_00735 [Chlamydiae bacterium RIFCSPHIGHO2_12_FULL_27_8]